MRRIGNGALVLAACVLAQPPTSVLAEPDTVARYLLDTPVSWMTYGVDKLERDLSALSPGRKAGVVYDIDANELQINVQEKDFWRRDITTFDAAKKVCEELIHWGKWQLLVNSDGSHFSTSPRGGLYSYFTPWGWGPGDQPKDLAERLEKLTILTSRVGFYYPDGRMEVASCLSHLRESGISVAAENEQMRKLDTKSPSSKAE